MGKLVLCEEYESHRDSLEWKIVIRELTVICSGCVAVLVTSYVGCSYFSYVDKETW
jgi:hypothetical protein